MKLKIFAIFIAIFSSVSPAQDRKQMPNGAELLASKLNEWEAAEKADLDRRIAEKREQVASALKSHLDDATKRGNLDGALAIRHYVENFLMADQTETLDDSKPQADSTMKLEGRSLARFLEDKEFFAPDSVDNETRHFENGKLFTLRKGGRLSTHDAEIEGATISWSVNDSEVLVTVISEDEAITRVQYPDGSKPDREYSVIIRPRSER